MVAAMTVAEIFKTMSYGPAPESDAEARRWLERHGPALDHLIANRRVAPAEGAYFDSLNPATGQPLIGVAQGGQADVHAAVAAARAAFGPWSRTPGHVRARYLYALARQVQKHSRLLAVLETLDNGKPIRESRDLDIPLVARHFYHHAGWAQLMEAEFPGHAPLGVVGAIIPWNFPLLMLAWKVAPALAAGNTVVLKPAEFTSVTAHAFAELAYSVGLPPGVLNIVTGDGRTGALLVEHPDVDKIAFTGSTDVGRTIRRATAGSGKRLSLELGGKSPFIVFDDADLDSVVEGVVDAIWFNQGQVCCAGSRLLVQENVADRLLARLRARMEKLRLGDPLDKAVDIGAIIAPVQLQKIRDLVEGGQRDGATMWQPSWACPAEGYFFPPTLFTDVSPASAIAQVEIFGPVLVSMTFRTKSEAVQLANNTPYGLAASVWSENINMALDVARALKAGVVWVNSTNLFDAAAGFGGYRESGFGREGGREGFGEYLRPVWPAGATALPALPTPSGGQDSPDDRLAPQPAVAVGAEIAPGVGDGLDLAWPTLPPIDRTPKLFIGGKQARPDSGYSRAVLAPDGQVVGEVGEGNRKDLRNAVEAAHAAAGWAATSGHARAQILYYIAENLSARADEFTRRLCRMTGDARAMAERETQAAIERLFVYAAWADKYDGQVHGTPLRGVTMALNEPLGVVALVCGDAKPLLGFVSLVGPAMAMGNTVIALPSERYPLAATDLYQVLETSDLPVGVVNIVTGPRGALAGVLADHDDVDALWYAGPPEGIQAIEAASAGNMKRTWMLQATPRDWLDPAQGAGREFLSRATQVKNIWVPSGD